MKDLIIVGAGGFGREVLEFALDVQEANSEINWRVKGFITDQTGDFDSKNTLGYNIIDDISHHKVNAGAVYVFAIGDIPFKMKVVKDFLSQGAEFINLIHPTAIIARTAQLGKGIVISPKVSINANVVVGDFVRIGTGSSIGHDVTIGDYSVINAECGVNGYAELKEGVFLGGHSVICPHVKVEEYSRVGAGAVVLKRVKRETTVFGNPAVRI